MISPSPVKSLGSCLSLTSMQPLIIVALALIVTGPMRPIVHHLPICVQRNLSAR